MSMILSGRVLLLACCLGAAGTAAADAGSLRGYPVEGGRRAPPRRWERRPAPPPDLIHAYLPRPTELPMYNEPPRRFPQR